ncbi:YbeD family protein [Sulfurimonas sp. CS5]|uniref:HP0495 family protein n=1 Tax=Sulfurimonas sp. CS5 TaxID=3391145 RepID=UPI0039E8B112
MEILNDRTDKLELTYPCSWSYKLIAGEKEALEKAIHDVIIEREHKLTHSKNSKGGKYVSMNLDLLVHNEDDRNFIYEALKAHQNIKMVL